ncbi:hypothetical protein BaRGS_00013187 [Batillaria attramentaria]|uniref:Uncharacterized protein n=1 Tax=Batillaria attramentaria TaxID=370345 RepID=A0ABD0L8Q7_9CAEN
MSLNQCPPHKKSQAARLNHGNTARIGGVRRQTMATVSHTNRQTLLRVGPEAPGGVIPDYMLADTVALPYRHSKSLDNGRPLVTLLCYKDTRGGDNRAGWGRGRLFSAYQHVP